MRKLVLCVLMGTLMMTVQAEVKRVALVVGNAAYEGTAALQNPVNDAQDIAAALKKIGWEVVLVSDADRRTFNRSIVSFRDSLSSSEGAQALFYYAGHGMQVDGTNYLIPVKTTFETLEDVKADAISLSTVTDAIADAKAAVSLVMLDACRDNPFAKKSTRSVGGTRGLSVVSVPATTGSVVMFATSPGDVAQDGRGRNGVFTAALLNHISEDSKIEDLFKKVTSEVRKVTSGAQNPWLNVSLSSDFYLVSESLRASRQAELARAAEAVRQKELALAVEKTQALPHGKLRIESFASGKVYLGQDLLGVVGQDAPLVSDSLPEGEQTVRFVSMVTGTEERSVQVTSKAYATVVFGQTQRVESPKKPLDPLALEANLSVQLRTLSPTQLLATNPNAMQIPELPSDARLRLYQALRHTNASSSSAANLIPFLGVGSLLQGDWFYGTYELASTGAFLAALNWVSSFKNNADIGPFGILFWLSGLNLVGSYVGGWFAPYAYESQQNAALAATLMVDTKELAPLH